MRIRDGSAAVVATGRVARQQVHDPRDSADAPGVAGGGVVGYGM
ncbi:hypothetical protein [Actinomyces sp. 565]|nr:hypothetical protein [Actinomyces sp. 565]